jgi:hypothetical protein
MAVKALPFGVFEKIATVMPGAMVESKCFRRKRP